MQPALDGLQLTIVSYPISDAFVTEIRAECGESFVVHGIAPTVETSRAEARTLLYRRLHYHRYCDLMVGG